jgi:hypothetical protein
MLRRDAVHRLRVSLKPGERFDPLWVEQESIGVVTQPGRQPPMPMATIPGSFADLLAGFRGCFTTPTFATFTALCGGLLAQPRLGTVTGMLAGARLAGRWHHARAHRFFSHARRPASEDGPAAKASGCPAWPRWPTPRPAGSRRPSAAPASSPACSSPRAATCAMASTAPARPGRAGPRIWWDVIRHTAGRSSAIAGPAGLTSV